MPIYEYRCESCGHTLDALQKINDAHLTDCPECEQPALKRLISPVAFRLKGGGWYETDFKSDKENKRNLAGEKSAEKKEGSGAGKEGGSTPEAGKSEKKDGADKSEGGKSGGGKSEGKTGASKSKPSGTEAA